MFCKSALLAVCAALLAGCAVSNVQKDYSLKDNPEQGIIIASVSFDLIGSRNFQAMFYLDGDNGSIAGVQRLESLAEPVMMFRKGSQFKDSYGQVLAISLPAGRHAITSWKLVRSAGYFISPAAPMAPLEFQVEAGKVRYIGNLHLNLAPARNVFGATVVADAIPEMRDRRERDLPLIRRRYPQFADNIEIQLLPQGPWVGNGETYRTVTPPVLMPVK